MIPWQAVFPARRDHGQEEQARWRKQRDAFGRERTHHEAAFQQKKVGGEQKRHEKIGGENGREAAQHVHRKAKAITPSANAEPYHEAPPETWWATVVRRVPATWFAAKPANPLGARPFHALANCNLNKRAVSNGTRGVQNHSTAARGR